MKNHCEVRFHLGAGQHFKHWQIKQFGENKQILYFEPTHQLVLHNCTLVSKLNKAKQVLDSQKRDVCGWVKCDKFEVKDYISIDNLKPVIYDPKISIHWTMDGECVDNTKIEKLCTHNRRLYCLPKSSEVESISHVVRTWFVNEGARSFADGLYHAVNEKDAFNQMIKDYAKNCPHRTIKRYELLRINR